MLPDSLNILRQNGLKLLIILVIGSVMFTTVPVQRIMAQGNILTNGTVVTGAITDQARIIIYSYVGAPGELVTAHVMGAKPEMNPTISLLSPSQQQLVVNDNDPFSITNTNDARISFILKEQGAYSFLVGGTNGDFILRFNVQKPIVTRPLRVNTPTEMTLQSGNPVALSFTPDVSNPVNLSMISTTAGFTFSARIYDSGGQLVAVLGNTALQGASFIIGPHNPTTDAGSFQVVIAPLVVNSQGKVSILLGAVAAPVTAKAPIQATPTQTQTPRQATLTPTITATHTQRPSVTPTYTPSLKPTIVNPNAPKGVCSATPNTADPVNIRSGPGINYAILDLLLPGEFLVLAGRSVDSAWYINLEGNKQAWVAAQVVTLNGPCETLDIIAAPPPPTASAVPTREGQPGTPIPTPTTKILVLPKTTNTPTLSVTATRTRTP